MHLVESFLPVRDNGGRAIEVEKFEAVREELTKTVWRRHELQPRSRMAQTKAEARFSTMTLSSWKWRPRNWTATGGRRIASGWNINLSRTKSWIRATAINKLISLYSDAAVAAPDKWQPGWTIETNVTGLTITAARELDTLRAPACPSTRPPQS
jgi:hypothetical protein